jgi:hypothetical protein
MNKRAQHAVQILIVVLAVAALASPFRAQAETQAACSLVSPTDVVVVFGEPIEHPQGETTGPISTCRFVTTAKPVKYMSVTILHVNDDLSSTKTFEELKQMLAPNAQKISGISDDCVWGSLSVSGTTVDEMLVRKGNSTTMVMVNGLPFNEDTLNRVKTLAQKIVPKVEP